MIRTPANFFVSLLQAMRSTGHAWSYKAWYSAVISCFSTALIGAFRLLLFTQWFAPSAIRCRTAFLLLYFLIVGIHASGISIPLSLLMLLGWSLIWIASLTSLCNETILDNEIMVSFDVESLFTNVPIDAVAQAALQKLENDPGLAVRTTLTPSQVANLLTFVLRSTYFRYNGSIYEQKDGAAIGSPVSGLVLIEKSEG